MSTSLPLFHGLSFSLDLPYTFSFTSKNELKKAIKTCGGTLSYLLTPTTSFLISTPDRLKKSSKFTSAQRYGTKIISIDFIHQSIESNTLLSFTDFLLIEPTTPKFNSFLNRKIPFLKKEIEKEDGPVLSALNTAIGRIKCFLLASQEGEHFTMSLPDLISSFYSSQCDDFFLPSPVESGEEEEEKVPQLVSIVDQDEEETTEEIEKEVEDTSSVTGIDALMEERMEIRRREKEKLLKDMQEMEEKRRLEKKRLEGLKAEREKRKREEREKCVQVVMKENGYAELRRASDSSPQNTNKIEEEKGMERGKAKVPLPRPHPPVRRKKVKLESENWPSLPTAKGKPYSWLAMFKKDTTSPIPPFPAKNIGKKGKKVNGKQEKTIVPPNSCWALTLKHGKKDGDAYRKLFISGFSFDDIRVQGRKKGWGEEKVKETITARQAHLLQIFQRFGDVEKVTAHWEKKYFFITFSSRSQAKLCLAELSDFKKRKVYCRKEREKGIAKGEEKLCAPLPKFYVRWPRHLTHWKKGKTRKK